MAALLTLKRALASPRTALRRRRARGGDRAGIALLEHFGYSDAIYSFIRATVVDPHVLHDVVADHHRVVFDIGGYRGEWCVPVDARHDVEIHSFEPAADALGHLRAATGDRPGVTVHPYGLAATARRASLAHKGPGSSIHARGAWERSEIELRDVVEALDRFGPVDVAKINIEGGEYELLDRLHDVGRLGDIDTYLIQFHEWLPAAHLRRWRIRRRLRSTHDLVFDHPFIWECWRRRQDA